jgi:hypothetical protein
MILFAAGVAAGVAAARGGRNGRHQPPSRQPPDLRRLLWGELVVAIGALGARLEDRRQPR